MMTRQRKAILQALCATRSHPTALDVFDAVRGAVPGITLATVYRNLRALQAQGAVREIEAGAEAGRFDACVEDHAHVRCEGCGRVDDLEMGNLAWLLQQAEQATDYVLTGQSVAFTGLCPQCQEATSGETPEHN
jgi:Fe2+ or Zn2+ uptake regulation protein